MQSNTPQITPFLMFEGDAEAAMTLYTTVFEDSRVDNIQRYGPEGPGKEGTVARASVTIENQTVMFTDSFVAHDFSFTPSFSFFVQCVTEQQFTRYYDALSKDGKEMMPPDNYGFSQIFCWIADRFGVSWQINLP